MLDVEVPHTTVNPERSIEWPNLGPARSTEWPNIGFCNLLECGNVKGIARIMPRDR